MIALLHRQINLTFQTYFTKLVTMTVALQPQVVDRLQIELEVLLLPFQDSIPRRMYYEILKII